MNDKLQTICHNVTGNFAIAGTQYLMDYKAAHLAFGLSLSDRIASQDKLDEAKLIIKKNTGMFSLLGNSAPRAIALSRMVSSADPAAEYDKIKATFDILKKSLSENTFVALTAALLADYPSDITALAAKASQINKIMRKKHFLGLSSKDHMVIAAMASSAKSVEDMMAEADAIFAAIKKEFFFAKDDAYVVSYLLASYNEPTEWKVKTLIALLNDLKEEKIKFSGYTTAAILAPLTIASLTTDRMLLVKEIVDADSCLASQKGIGGVFGLSSSVRQAAAAGCVIKAYAENGDEPYSVAEYLVALACESEIKSEQDSATTVVIT